MVKKIFFSLGKEINNLHEAAYLLGIFAFVSQILGLFRDRMFAHYFGADSTLDIYYSAFRIPDLIFISIASLVSMSVLIPVFQKELLEGKEKAKKFIDNIFSSFFLVMILVSLATMFLMPSIVKSLYYFNTKGLSEVVNLSRILLLSPIFLGLSNLLASITQSYRRIVLYAFTPLVYNISIILGLVFLYPSLGLSGVIIGVIIGTILHAGIQMPFIKSVGLMPDFIWPIDWKKVINAIKVSLPRTFALSASNLALLGLVAFASKLKEGSITIFNFAYNLQAVPLAIIGLSYSMAAFPVLSKHFLEGNKKKFLDQVASASKHIIFLSLPIIVLFIVLRAQIVRTVLGSGAFSWEDTRLTAACFALFSISVIFQSLSLLFIRAFYASGKTKIPLIANLFSSILIFFIPILILKSFEYIPSIAYFFTGFLRIDGVAGFEVIALPLGFSIGAFINTLILFIWFEKRVGMISLVLRKSISEGLMASLAGGIVSYISLQLLEGFLNLNTFIGIMTQGLVSGVLGIITWVLVLLLFKSKEINELLKTFRRKILKEKPLISEPTDL